MTEPERTIHGLVLPPGAARSQQLDYDRWVGRMRRYALDDEQFGFLMAIVEGSQDPVREVKRIVEAMERGEFRQPSGAVESVDDMLKRGPKPPNRAERRRMRRRR